MRFEAAKIELKKKSGKGKKRKEKETKKDILVSDHSSIFLALIAKPFLHFPA
jgi:hypothetical protein